MQHTDRYDDVSATTNMEGVNTKEIENEIKGNEVEINWQSDYLQARTGEPKEIFSEQGR